MHIFHCTDRCVFMYIDNAARVSKFFPHVSPFQSPGFTQVRCYRDDSSKRPPSSSLPTTADRELPHLTPSKTVHMTQITPKPVTERLATASCHVSFSNPRPYQILRHDQGHSHKGDVFSVARVAGIMAVKRTPDIVPLCHPGIGITGAEVDVRLVGPEEAKQHIHGAMEIVTTVTCLGRTGVEMEAMTAAVGAALTVYDMLKAVDKAMVIGQVQLLEKEGGKSGYWSRSA